MDRSTIYTQEQGRSVDFLFAQRATMIGLAKLSQAAFGSGTVVRGLAVTPNSPAALNVLVGIGEIYAMTQVDATTWGALPADTTDIILKQGLNMAAQTISTPAPTTSGYSINYLIEAQYQDQDNVPVVLPFYNSNNPQIPLNGQGGGGASLPTERQGVCVIQAKAGIAATTGTQTTPSVDSGWTALAVVTVANGQSTVVSGNISVPAGVPQLTSLLQMMQSGSTEYAVDTSTSANVITIALTPPITAYTDAQPVTFKAANSNTGPCTINFGGGTVNLVGAAGALQGGEIVAGNQYTGLYSASLNEVVLNSQTAGALQVNPATKSEHAVQLGQLGHGQCRLSVSSTTALLLKPYNGNNVIVNGIPLQLPSAGLTVSNSGLSASTLYYVYLSGTTASPTLSLSTTGHSTASNGVETQTGNSALTLVGMICTNGSSQFVDAPTTRYCLNWFNRRGLSAVNTGASTSTFTNSSAQELSSTYRNSFLSWGDETTYASVDGLCVNQTAGDTTYVNLATDGTLAGAQSGGTSSTANTVQTFSSSALLTLSEGLHYTTLFTNVSA